MKLINHVLDIRRLIQQAFDNRFSRMGLRADAPVPADQLSDSDHRQRRQKLDDIMQNHLNELGDYAEARQATINECVFTLFNRIAAIKVMESKELFPEIIRRRKENAGRSFEHNAWLEEHPSERNAEREGLKHFLNDQFDKLGEHIPLYRSDYPYALMPTADELNEIIVQFNNVEEDEDCGADVWKGDDILGWLYENFNAVEKETLKASGEKTEYNKVSLQSQVYTPAWVVKFLVDNTLGKSYLEMYPESSIKEKYKIANAPTKQVKHPKDLRSIRLLDPACGSGNFLIYSFSLFYDLYIDQMENYGKDYSRRDIPKMIVENNLFGMDLDERAAQISQIALFIKARELGGHRSHWPEYTNVVSTHFFLPEYAKIKDTFEILGSWSKEHIKAIEDVWNDLCSAYKFGSLVRVEERLNALMPNDVNHSLFKEFEMENLFDFKNSVTTQLRNQVNAWSGEGSNPYTLAKTSEAMDFLQIISQKYDIVVANPPYTPSDKFGTELKKFIDNNYSSPVKVRENLYSCFIIRLIELCHQDGYMGIICPQTFMFIDSFKELRDHLLKNQHINQLVQFGFGGIFKESIDPVFFTLKKSAQETTETTCFKYDDIFNDSKISLFNQQYSEYVNGTGCERIYSVDFKKLLSIKNSPFIYWISDEFRSKFATLTFEDVADVKQGIATGNNNKFCRFWWEIKGSNDIYHPYAKGGTFNRWAGNLWLYINWSEESVKEINEKGRLQNKSFYFKEGITYSASGRGGYAFRHLPEGCLFDVGGSSIFIKDDSYDPYYLLALLNSKLCFFVADALNPTANIQVGDLRRVPVAINKDYEKDIIALSHQCVELTNMINSYRIVEENYRKSPISNNGDIITVLKSFYLYEAALKTVILLNESVINKLCFLIYDLSSKDIDMVLGKQGIPCANLPVKKESIDYFCSVINSISDFELNPLVIEHIKALKISEYHADFRDFENLNIDSSSWEETCDKNKCNPMDLLLDFYNASSICKQRNQTLAFELLTDVIKTVLDKDDDGIIPLGDKMGEERLAIRIEREFIDRNYNSAQFNQICNLLGNDFEKYLSEKYFSQLSNHLNLFNYLPKTPFIWHLSSGDHHAIELFVSIYKWSRDALFRVRSIYVANREAAIKDRLNSIDTSKTEGRVEATELRAMLEELNSFCQKIDDLLASGYDPKLDDGVGKNIAPLQKRKMLSYEVLNAGQLKKYLNADW